MTKLIFNAVSNAIVIAATMYLLHKTGLVSWPKEWCE